MPRLPTYDGPQVEQRALSGGFQDAGPAMAQGRALQGLGRALGGVAEDIDRVALRAETDAAFRAETEIKAGWLQHDQDLRKRFRGANAAGYEEAAREWWGKAESEFGGKLSPRARQLAARSLTAARGQALTGAIAYVNAETERSQEESFHASKGVEIQRALADLRPEVVATSRGLLLEQNARQGALKGWSPEKLQLENLRDTTVLHGSVITKMADADAKGALAYFNAHKDEIDATKHETYRKALETAGRLELAQTTADDVMQRFTDLGEAMAHVEKSFSGEDERAIKSEVASRFSIKKAAEAERQDTLLGQALVEVESTGRVRPSTLNALEPKHQATVMNRMQAEARFRRAEARAAAGDAAAKVKTDWGTYIALRERIAAGEKVDVKGYVDKLAGGQIEQLLDLQLRRADPKKAPEAVSMEQQMGAALSMLKIKPSDPKAGLFKSRAFDEFQAYARAHDGKEPPYEERQKIIDRLSIERDDWFGSTRYFEVAGTGKAADFTPEIPDTDRATLVASFQKRGVPKPTDDQIMQAFRAWKGLN